MAVVELWNEFMESIHKIPLFQLSWQPDLARESLWNVRSVEFIKDICHSQIQVFPFKFIPVFLIQRNSFLHLTHKENFLISIMGSGNTESDKFLWTERTFGNGTSLGKMAFFQQIP